MHKEETKQEEELKLEEAATPEVEINELETEKAPTPEEVEAQANEELQDEVTLESFTKEIDTQIETAIEGFKKQLEANNEMSEEEKTKALKQFEDNLTINKEKALHDFEFQKEYTALMAELQHVQKEFDGEFSRAKVLEQIDKLIEFAEGKELPEAVKHYSFLRSQVNSAVSLEILFEEFDKIKNPKKIYDKASDSVEFYKEFKKFVKNLEENQKYIFKHPSGVEDKLVGFMGEDQRINVRILLYSLSRFINTKGQDGVNRYAMFISYLIKNMHAVDSPKLDPAIMMFIDNINKYTSKFFPE